MLQKGEFSMEWATRQTMGKRWVARRPDKMNTKQTVGRDEKSDNKRKLKGAIYVVHQQHSNSRDVV